MLDAEEATLVRRCLQGDDGAFRELVERYKDLVYGMLARSVADRARVDELAQDVFLRIHRGLPYFRGDASLRTWIFRIVLNQLSQESAARAARREVPLDPADARHEPGAADRTPGELELRDRLGKALARLSPQYRLVIAAHYLDGVPYEDLAAALDVPVGTIKTHLHRARKQLRELLDTEYR